MINYKDYYVILGIAKTATAEEIKKAFRKLAVKFHPDKTKGDKAANERFKEINEANQVLSNQDKRKKYDQFGADWKNYEETGAPPGGFNWSKYTGGGTTQKQRMNADGYESTFSSGDEIDLFEMLLGERGRKRPGRPRTVYKGDDLHAEATISLEEAYPGTTRLILLDDQTIRVTIPPGIFDKQVLRIAGKGISGVNGGSTGDLYLMVKIASHPEFHRKGVDLRRDSPVELYTAILGGKTLVETW